MDTANLGTLGLAEQRLRWLDRRQAVLAQNVANADTPGFRPSDLSPFAARLAGAQAIARTDPRHLGRVGSGADGAAVRDRNVPERTPNGNMVSLDQQAVKVAETEQAHALAIALHQRWIGMLRTSLGRG